MCTMQSDLYPLKVVHNAYQEMRKYRYQMSLATSSHVVLVLEVHVVNCFHLASWPLDQKP